MIFNHEIKVPSEIWFTQRLLISAVTDLLYSKNNVQEQLENIFKDEIKYPLKRILQTDIVKLNNI